jgi:hypothetical protein
MLTLLPAKETAGKLLADPDKEHPDKNIGINRDRPSFVQRLQDFDGQALLRPAVSGLRRASWVKSDAVMCRSKLFKYLGM